MYTVMMKKSIFTMVIFLLDIDKEMRLEIQMVCLWPNCLAKIEFLEESLNDDDYEFEREFLEDILDLEEVEQVPNPASKILPHPYEAFPYQRYGHTVVMYGGKAYLWGGRNDEAGASDILHEYDPS